MIPVQSASNQYQRQGDIDYDHKKRREKKKRTNMIEDSRKEKYK
jgi:hypothetical protein